MVLLVAVVLNFRSLPFDIQLLKRMDGYRFTYSHLALDIKRFLCTPTNDSAQYSDLHLFHSAFRIGESYVGVGIRHTGILLVAFSFCQCH